MYVTRGSKREGKNPGASCQNRSISFYRITRHLSFIFVQQATNNGVGNIWDVGHLFLCPHEHLSLQFVAQGAWLTYTTLATSLGNTTLQPAPEIHKRKLRATFSKKAFWMPQEAPLDARVSSTLPPTTLLRSILCLSRTGFPILVASSVGWTQHLLLLSHDSFATQNGVQAPGTQISWRSLFESESPPSPQILWIRIFLTTSPLPHPYYRWSVIHWTLGSTMLGHLFPVNRNKTMDSDQPWNHSSVDFNPNCILNHLSGLKITLALCPVLIPRESDLTGLGWDLDIICESFPDAHLMCTLCQQLLL